MLYLFLHLTFPIAVCVRGCTQPKQNYVILCNGYKINSIKLSFIITLSCSHTVQRLVLTCLSLVQVASLQFACNFLRLPHPLSINSWTTGLGAHLSLSLARSRPGGILTPPQAYIYLGVACATLVGSSIIPYSRCGTCHTCWLIHHLRGVVLAPLFQFTYLQGVLLPPLDLPGSTQQP